MFKLAMIQMRVEGGRKQTNLKRASCLVEEAADAGANIVVLPEAMTLGWTYPPAENDGEDSVPGGDSCQRLAQLAREQGVYLCSGIIETSAQEGCFNSAILIDPDGEVILHHRKLNELEIAHSVYRQGDRLGVVQTPLGTIGLMICADAFASGDVISRTLGYAGADIILSPCSWAVEANHDNDDDPYGQLWVDHYEPVAREFRMWIVGVSNVGWLSEGPWKGRRCIGNSLAMSPSGQRTWGPYGVEAETIVYVDVSLEPRPARGDGWAARSQDLD